MDVFFQGIKALYREPQDKDLEFMRRWLNDKEVTKYLYRGSLPFRSADETEALNLSGKDSGSYPFTILSLSGDPIGVAGLHAVHPISRCGEYRVLLGDRGSWGNGIGSESLQFICAFAFEVLNMHKVYLGVNVENSRAVKGYKACGFIEEGRLREEYYRSGRYFDILRMGMLYNEYKEKRRQWGLYQKIAEHYPLSV